MHRYPKKVHSVQEILFKSFKTTKLFNKQHVQEKCKRKWRKTAVSSKVFPGIMVPFVRKRNRICKQDCARCEAIVPSSSSLHISVSEMTENIMFKADDLINKKSTLAPKKTANGQLQMMNI